MKNNLNISELKRDMEHYVRNAEATNKNSTTVAKNWFARWIKKIETELSKK